MQYEIKAGSALLTKREYRDFTKGDTICSEYIPKVIAKYETLEEAKQALNDLKCRYVYRAFDGCWSIEEYGFIEIDEEHDYMQIYLAEECTKEYVVYDDDRKELFRTQDYDQAEDFVENAEREADNQGE